MYTGNVGRWIINEVERKVALLRFPRKSVEKVLITTGGVTRDLAEAGYFSRILGSECLFG